MHNADANVLTREYFAFREFVLQQKRVHVPADGYKISSKLQCSVEVRAGMISGVENQIGGFQVAVQILQQSRIGTRVRGDL